MLFGSTALANDNRITYRRILGGQNVYFNEYRNPIKKIDRTQEFKNRMAKIEHDRLKRDKEKLEHKMAEIREQMFLDNIRKNAKQHWRNN